MFDCKFLSFQLAIAGQCDGYEQSTKFKPQHGTKHSDIVTQVTPIFVCKDNFCVRIILLSLREPSVAIFMCLIYVHGNGFSNIPFK